MPINLLNYLKNRLNKYNRKTDIQYVKVKDGGVEGELARAKKGRGVFMRKFRLKEGDSPDTVDKIVDEWMDYTK